MAAEVLSMRNAFAFIALSSAGIACFAAVDVVYFQTLGYSLAFIGLMAAAFNIALTAAELPFAVLFDRYSNKRALQIGNALRIAAFALFFANLNESSLVLAQIIAGVATAAMTGTSNAIIVNSLPSRDPDVIAKAYGKITYVSAAAGIVGGLTGVLIFAVWPQGIWLAAIVFFVAAGIVIAFFRDKITDHHQLPWPKFVRQALGTVRAPHAWLVVVTNAAAVAPFFLWQVKFNEVSLVFLAIGYLGLNIANLVGPMLLRILKIRVAHLAVVAIINVAATVAFALSEGPVLIWASFVVHVALQGMLQVLVAGLFHQGVPDGVRATAVSILSMTHSLVVALVAPVVTWVGQTFGLGWGVSISAVLYLLIIAGGLQRRIRQAGKGANGENDADVDTGQ